VVVENSKVNGSIVLDTDREGSSAWSLTLVDSEVDAGLRELAAVSTGNMTVVRSDIHGGITAVQCENNSVYCTVRDSYLHGQQMPADADWHLGGFLSDGGQNITLTHNYIVCDTPQSSIGGGCTGDVNLIPNFAPISGALIQGNFLGANPDAAFCTYGGEKPPSATPHSDHVVYKDNIFQRGPNGKCADYGPVNAFELANPGNQWIGNTWDDGTPVAPAN
jgi:hypothetical protein